MNNEENLERGCMAWNTRRNGSGATLPAIGVNIKEERSFHLSEEKDFMQPFIFKGVIRPPSQKVGIFHLAFRLTLQARF